MQLTKAGTNAIHQLAAQGQSLWLDNLQRGLIKSGELGRLRDAGITGITSNPTIFQKAIIGATEYHEEMSRLRRAGRQPDQMLWDLMVEDIQAAADIFRPVYDATGGGDGFVSIEVGPAIADDTSRTIAMAQELHRRCDRPNVMVKIPATPAGIPAIQHMIAHGKHTNITLIFSVGRYAEVVEAYLSGLEDLLSHGGDVRQVASVASFFVSRVDTKIDKLLTAQIEAAASEKTKGELAGLYGKAGIANSKLAYQRYRELFSGPRWEALERAGARVQRCLWASTSVKDARYRDTMYVEELIGPDTVNTVPNATLSAFQDHGQVRASLVQDVDGARRHLTRLAKVGIDLDQVTSELEVEGVDAFLKSYDSLLEVIAHVSENVRAA
ncbi:MAG: transaldolase [Chloroflexota bacterium]|nr:transaldolase [Chloroflexota bacterium]